MSKFFIHRPIVVIVMTSLMSGLGRRFGIGVWFRAQIREGHRELRCKTGKLFQPLPGKTTRYLLLGLSL